MHAPGLQILIAEALPRGRETQRSYVHEAELVPHRARDGVGETHSHQYLFP